MDTSLVKMVLDWTEDKITEIDNDIANGTNEIKHPYLKAFGLGAIEGAIDGAVVMYPIVLAAGYYWKHKATKK